MGIKFSNRGGGFQIPEEGEQDFLILDVEVNPPAGEPKQMDVKCVNRDGVKWNNRYALPRGESALYVFVTKGLGFDPDEFGDDGFDPILMIGRAFRAEIVHREGSRGGTFANLGNIIGPVAPWASDEVAVVEEDIEDDDLL